MISFDRFTERAQEAATHAYEIMQRYQHTQLDTEHILLALLEQTDGIVPTVLAELKVDLGAMRRRLDDVLKASPRASMPGGLPAAAGVYHAARQAADGSRQRRGLPAEG